jgi:hypothetical protein
MRSSLLAGLVAGLLLATPSLADVLQSPSGSVVLQVTGAISNTNDERSADFDMAMLDQLPGRVTTTKSPWYDGAQTFGGPLGWALLNAVGAKGTMLRVTALNDYVTDIPVADFKDYPVILATSLDGRPMSVRDKGPIFIIYPFDEAPALNNETYYGRSAWQVKSIEVY